MIYFLIGIGLVYIFMIGLALWILYDHALGEGRYTNHDLRIQLLEERIAQLDPFGEPAYDQVSQLARGPDNASRVREVPQKRRKD